MTEINQPVSPFIENFDSVEKIAEEFSPHVYGDSVPAIKGRKASEYLSILTDLEESVIHLAWYGYGDYCGSALVIYERNGKLYEVNASHCSCNGLEDQWMPEETSWESLKMRTVSSWYDNHNSVNAILQGLVAKHLQ